MRAPAAFALAVATLVSAIGTPSRGPLLHHGIGKGRAQGPASLSTHLVPLGQHADFGETQYASDDTIRYSKLLVDHWHSPTLDDSSWTPVVAPSGGLCNPASVARIPGSTALPVWAHNPQAHETVYFRKTITVPTPRTAYIRVLADDDFDLYINGVLVKSDNNGTWTLWEGDVSRFVIGGMNLIALKVRDSFGGCQSIAFDVTAQHQAVPFLELPFDYSGSTFVAEVSDTESRPPGKLNAYFDHEYPTYGAWPNLHYSDSNNPNIVNFEGFLGTQTSPTPPYTVVYNGHDGYDFALGKGTGVLVAERGTGTVEEIGTDACTGKYVRVRHSNGYATEYLHLDTIAEGLVEGNLVERYSITGPVPGALLGTVGDTGSCADGPHLHLRVISPGGEVVDPFGWQPLPDSPYAGQPDPWQAYKGDAASSGYLWIHASTAVGVYSPSLDLTLATPSGSATLTLPPGSHASPLQVRMIEGLHSMHVQGYRATATFTAAAWDLDGNLINELTVPSMIEVMLGEGSPLSPGLSGAPPDPRLFVRDPEDGSWDLVPSEFEPATRSIHAETSSLGMFAVVVPGTALHLPLVTR